MIDAVAFALQLCKDFPKIQCCSPLKSACSAAGRLGITTRFCGAIV